MSARDVVMDRGRHLRRRWGGLVDGARRRAFLDPSLGCPIPWKPSVFAPVFYGFRDTTATLPQVGVQDDLLARQSTHGAGLLPGEAPAVGHPVRVWFPTLDGSPQHAQILKGCGRYPLVILAHGSCPADDDAYQQWVELPAVLARSGYVVVVPDLRLGAPSGNEGEQRLVGQLSRWARSDWEHADAVMPPPATALVGHSWGAGLLGHVAAQTPSAYAAFVSLSGVEVPGGVHRSPMPKLFTWGGELAAEVLTVPLSQWDRLTPPAHVAEFHHAGHWDYLPAGRSTCDHDEDGTLRRGSCTLTPFLAADVVACFLTRYLRPEGVPTRRRWWNPLHVWQIHRSLRPPWFFPNHLTLQQNFYAGGHLQAWKTVPAHDDCGVTLRWVVDGEVGELVHD